MASKSLKLMRPASRIRSRKESSQERGGLSSFWVRFFASRRNDSEPSIRFGHARRRGLGDEFGGFKHRGAERRRDHHPKWDQDAGSGDRRERDFDVALR